MTNRGRGFRKAALAILLLTLTTLALPAAADDGAAFSWRGLWAQVIALVWGDDAEFISHPPVGGEANAETPPGDDAEFIPHPPVGG